jgi:hypothetical protein
MPLRRASVPGIFLSLASQFEAAEPLAAVPLPEIALRVLVLSIFVNSSAIKIIIL